MNPISASARAISKAVSKPASLLTSLIPRPPPPAEAFIITGYPISLASSLASWEFSNTPLLPGITGTPASFIVRLASALSPIIEIAFEEGPMNLNPMLSTISAKAAFSAKKPYPGCMASAAEISAAANIRLGLR